VIILPLSIFYPSKIKSKSWDKSEKGSDCNLAVRMHSTLIHDLDFMEFKQIQTFDLTSKYALIVIEI
jgi:hypothetical protein